MKKRKLDIDILKVSSMLMIILMHVMGNTINTFGIGGRPAFIYNIIINICFIAIPIFVMVSGANFLNKDISIKDLFRKYILKILLALVVFGFFYSALEIVFETRFFGIKDIFTCFKNILTGNLWAHMWYLYLVVGLYLITPVLRTITKEKNGILEYFLIILFLFTMLIPEITMLTKINIAFYTLISSVYLFYYLYGFYIYYHKVSSLYEYLSYFLGILSFILIIIFSSKNIYLEYISYTSILVFLLANAIMIFVCSFNNKKEGLFTKMIHSLAKCSFGIYLTHQIYINLIYKFFKFTWILKSPYLGLIIYSIAVLLVSYLFVYLFKKIRLIDKYLL